MRSEARRRKEVGAVFFAGGGRGRDVLFLSLLGLCFVLTGINTVCAMAEDAGETKRSVAAEQTASGANAGVETEAKQYPRRPRRPVRLIIRDLRGRDATRRLRAVEECRLLGADAAAATGALLELLEGRELRARVLQALGNMGQAALPAAAKVAACLADENKQIRAAAGNALLRIGSHTLDYVAPYLDKTRPTTTRLAALFIVAAFGQKAAWLRGRLRQLVKDDNERISHFAEVALMLTASPQEREAWRLKHTRASTGKKSSGVAK